MDRQPIIEITQEELAEFLRAQVESGRGGEAPGCAFVRIGEAGGIAWYAVAAQELSRETGELTVRAKVARNCDGLQCDYYWDWEMPVSEDSSEVLDSDIQVTAESAGGDAAWLLICFLAIPEFMAPRQGKGGSL